MPDQPKPSSGLGTLGFLVLVFLVASVIHSCGPAESGAESAPKCRLYTWAE